LTRQERQALQRAANRYAQQLDRAAAALEEARLHQERVRSEVLTQYRESPKWTAPDGGYEVQQERLDALQEKLHQARQQNREIREQARTADKAMEAAAQRQVIPDTSPVLVDLIEQARKYAICLEESDQHLTALTREFDELKAVTASARHGREMVAANRDVGELEQRQREAQQTYELAQQTYTNEQTNPTGRTPQQMEELAQAVEKFRRELETATEALKKGEARRDTVRREVEREHRLQRAKREREPRNRFERAMRQTRHAIMNVLPRNLRMAV
jgi:hypothetical protein